MRIPLLAGMVLLAAGAAPVQAVVKTASQGASFANQPFFFGFYYGTTPLNAITFTANPGDFSSPVAVSTQANLQIASLGAPFYDPAQPTSYFDNRGGTIGPDLLATFASYSTPAVVPFSASPTIIGFRFDNGAGYQYGYAEVVGTYLRGIRYETTPGVGIAIAPVPEPATWAMMIGGFAMIGFAARRHRMAAIA